MLFLYALYVDFLDSPAIFLRLVVSVDKLDDVYFIIVHHGIVESEGSFFLAPFIVLRYGCIADLLAV